MRATTDKTDMRRTQAHANRASSTGPAERPGGSADPAGADLEAAERFRMLFDRASVGIVSVATNGSATEANPAAERMLGYTAEELAEMSFGAFTHPDDMENS